MPTRDANQSDHETWKPGMMATGMPITPPGTCSVGAGARFLGMLFGDTGDGEGLCLSGDRSEGQGGAVVM